MVMASKSKHQDKLRLPKKGKEQWSEADEEMVEVAFKRLEREVNKFRKALYG